MNQIDPHKAERAGERAIEFVMGLLHEPRFWVLIIVLILGMTFVKHGWPWHRKS